MVLNLINGLVGGLGGGIAPKSQAPASVPFKTYVQVESGDAAYNTAAEVIALITGVVHASFLKIWQKTVPSQQQIRWGSGSPAYQRNQGYMWFCSIDTGTDFDVGVLRLVQANARETKVYVVAEMADRRLHLAVATTMITATPTSINDMIPIPEKVEFPKIGEDSLLILTYALNVIATTHDDAAFEIPISVYQ